MSTQSLIVVENKNKRTGMPHTGYMVFIDIKIGGKYYRILQRKKDEPYRYGSIPENGVLCPPEERRSFDLTSIVSFIVKHYNETS